MNRKEITDIIQGLRDMSIDAEAAPVYRKQWQEEKQKHAETKRLLQIAEDNLSHERNQHSHLQMATHKVAIPCSECGGEGMVGEPAEGDMEICTSCNGEGYFIKELTDEP